MYEEPKQEEEPIRIDYGDIVSEQEDGFAKVTGYIQDGKYEIHVAGSMESLNDFISGEHQGKLLSIQFEQVDAVQSEQEIKEAEIRHGLYARLDAIRRQIDKTYLPNLRDPYLISQIDRTLGTEARLDLGKLNPERDRVIEIVPTGELEKGCVYRLTYHFDPWVGYRRFDHWQAGYNVTNVSTGFFTRGGDPLMYEYYSSYESRYKLVVYGQSSPDNLYDINPSWTLTADDWYY